MNNQPKPTDDKDDLKYQTEQARRVLMRLQWLVIILLASGIVWLYVAFESVVGRVDERLAKIDGIDTRLNGMDDRIFALTPTDTLPAQLQKADTPSKDRELIYIQLGLVNQLFEQGNYEGTLTALRAIQWQLPQTDGMASPVKSALAQSLDADIARLTALKNQPDAWQAHIVKMRDLQAFLRSQQNHHATLNRKDILLHDTTMLLSLAIGSANIRDKEQTNAYLTEAKSQLESYITLNGGNTQIDPNAKPTKLTSTKDALYAFYELLANSPKDEPLQSVQILKNSNPHWDN